MNPTSDSKWFLQLNGKVQGPYNPESLQALIQSLGMENTTKALVWSRGLTEWVKADKWKISEFNALTAQDVASSSNLFSNQNHNQALGQFSNDEATQISNPQEGFLIDDEGTKATAISSSPLLEKTKAQTFIKDVFYKVKINFIDQPPMSKAELLLFIAKQPDISKVLIQDQKTNEWKDVYNFPDILERLGLSRRQLPRVLIMAQFTGRSTNSTENVSYRVINISQSGMGFTENFDLRIGDEVEGQIASPHFFQALNVKAEVVYAGQDGYIGLKFIQIPDEALASIIDYVKKYSKNPANLT